MTEPYRIRQDTPDFHETTPKPSHFVIFDLDGVVIRYPQFHTIDPEEFMRMGQVLSDLRKEGGRISVLTNRPPAEMQPIAYYLGEREGLWVTESGGSVYDVAKHKVQIPSQWYEYSEGLVPQLRKRLSNKLGITQAPRSTDGAQFLPSLGPIKTVILPPDGQTGVDYAASGIAPVLQEGHLLGKFSIKVGKAIDVDPTGLSKASGMEEVLRINGIDPKITPTLFIADHERDIDAAKVLARKGGSVAAVGNADQVFLDHVESAGGIIADKSTSYHGSVAGILRQFLSR